MQGYLSCNGSATRIPLAFQSQRSVSKEVGDHATFARLGAGHAIFVGEGAKHLSTFGIGMHHDQGMMAWLTSHDEARWVTGHPSSCVPSLPTDCEVPRIQLGPPGLKDQDLVEVGSRLEPVSEGVISGNLHEVLLPDRKNQISNLQWTLRIRMIRMDVFVVQYGLWCRCP